MKDTGWIKAGTEVVCVNDLTLDMDGSPITFPKGSKGIVEWHRQGKAQIHVEIGPLAYWVCQLLGDLVYYWEPKAVRTSRERPKRPLVVKINPSCAPNSEAQKRLPKRLYVGFWASSHDPDGDTYEQEGHFLPWPADHVDNSWDPKERSAVVRYLKESPKVEHYRGYSWCRLGCGRDVNMGTSEHSDGVYQWPEGFVHYVDEHSVCPPKEMIDHILSRSS